MANLFNTTPFYTERLPAGLRVAQVVGLTSAAFIAGKTFSQSFSTVPALLLAPPVLLVAQWKKMFDSDKLLAPLGVLVGSSVFGFFAWREPTWTKTSILYTTSAALLTSLIPYTYLAGEPINQQLEASARDFAGASIVDHSAEAGIAKEKTAHVLVDRWATVNLGRAVISGLAAALATWAAVDRLEVVETAVGIASGADRLGR